MHRLLTAVASLVGEHGLSGAVASVVAGYGLSSFDSWALEHRLSRVTSLVAPSMWSNLVALRHVGSFWPGDQPCVPGISRWMLHHWTTKEFQDFS